METLRTFDAEVEVAGWDEAFLAVTTEDPETFAKRIQERVLERTRLWCTIGIGDNRLQAKLASGFGKPRGVFVLTSDRWDEAMLGLPTTELWGIGAKTAAKLDDLGIRTVGQLADADEAALAERFGPSTGPWLASLGRGEGPASVHPEGWTAKGRSREHTFQRDLTDPDEVAAEVARTAREVASDLQRDDRLAARVVVKVRFAPFFTSTHGVTLAEPTADADLRGRGRRSRARAVRPRPARPPRRGPSGDDASGGTRRRMSVQYHLKLAPGDVAPYVLLPGDPGRVPLVASLWDESREVASNREYVTFTGTYRGVPISCTSTGIGCPSTAIAMEELARVGATTFVRIGTCGTFQDRVRNGDMAIFDSAARYDGASRLYAPLEFPAVASHEIVDASIAAGEALGYPFHVGTTRTADSFYAMHPRPGSSFNDYWQSSWGDHFEDLKRHERDRRRDGGERDLRAGTDLGPSRRRDRGRAGQRAEGLGRVGRVRPAGPVRARRRRDRAARPYGLGDRPDRRRAGRGARPHDVNPA